VTVSIVLTGCGSMTSSTLHDRAARAALDGGSGTGGQNANGQGAGGTAGPGPGTTSGGPGLTTGAATGGSTGTSTGGSGGGGASGGNGTTTVGAPNVAGGNGGATATGVTSNSVTVSTVATLSGPVPGLFQGAVAGVKAYFAYVNSQGGLFGRALKVDPKDDAFSCSTNQKVTADGIKSDFALVGSFSIYDYCGAQAIKAAPGVSDVSMSISPDHTALKNTFPVQPVTQGFRTGAFEYYKAKFGDAYQTTGALYVNSPSAKSAYDNSKATMKHLGYNVVYERAVTPTDSNFTSDVIQMRQQNVKFVVLEANPPIIANFMAAAAQQGFKPVVTTPGQGYDPATLSQGGSAVEGLYTDTPSALYFNKDDAAHIPEVALYQKWMATAAPGVGLDLFSVYGWGQAELFVQAARKVGPKLTRPALLSALASIETFADEILAPGGPATKRDATCYVITKVVKGSFVRVDTPPTSFRCDGSFYRTG
jgi:ABC-type branched-subunit amino acid transport system substrate-binding protein